MTNEEAIDYLVGIKKYYTEDKDFGYYGDEYHGLTVKEKEALCLAISVLNHSATDINVATKDGDMVYRQDAIDALDCINGTEEVLRSLPSVQPEQRWILSGKKPLKEGNYLVWMPFAPPKHRMAVAEYCGGYWNIKTPISAWMPLPEPEPYNAERREDG